MPIQAFTHKGPQGLIDPILRIEDGDVLLGIFWKRFGTPTTDAGSGTEHEFLRAYASWQQHRRPQIMAYFNHQRPEIAEPLLNLDQYGAGAAIPGAFSQGRTMAAIQRQSPV